MYILETGRVIVDVAWEEAEEDDDTADILDDAGILSAKGRRSSGVRTPVSVGTAPRQGRGAKGKGKGKAKEYITTTSSSTATATMTTQAQVELQHHSPSLPSVGFLDGTANIDNDKLRRRCWEHTPVFGMDDEEGVDDNDDEDDNESNERYDEDNHEAAEDDNDDADDEDGQVLFDSQDEDECDDLFAGIWNADVVRERRMSRRVSWARRNIEGGREA